MGKITFRADDDLVDQVEALEGSKSEVMRQALRAYLEERGSGAPASARRTRGAPAGPDSFDALLAERIDAAIDERLAREPRDVNVNITVDDTRERETGAAVTQAAASDDGPSEGVDEPRPCAQCGEPVDAEHVYCPNCGEKQSRRVFCDCGDELRTDWSFCPSCGRRTPAADVLDRS